MSLKQKMVEQSRKALNSPALMKWVTDDRFLKAAEGVMDARTRVKDAWHVLLNGHALPNVDPALDDVESRAKVDSGPNGASATATNGGSATHTNGASRAGAARNGHSYKNGTSISAGSSDLNESMNERHSLSNIGGKDVLEKCYKFTAADNARKRGIYPCFRPLD